MSVTKKILAPEFVIDSSRDHLYHLFTSEQPEPTEYMQEIPLSNISWESLEKLAHCDWPSTTVEALLIPTDSAHTISVVVGTTVIGTLPDPSVISDSQIARVYASGFIPTCTLVLTPRESTPAKVRLFTPDGGVPFNDPPQELWTLLPSGALWRVEPTKISPFEKIPDRSQIFVELRPIDGLIHILLNGIECGILDMDAADAMCGAVSMAIRDGYTPIARGCVQHQGDGHVSLHINARAFEHWRKSDLRLNKSPSEKLIPYEADPLKYRHKLQKFTQDHEISRNHPVNRCEALLASLNHVAPLLVVFLGLISFIITVAFDDLSARGTVGLVGVSSVLFILGTWVLTCRKRDTPAKRQTRYWNFLIPLSVSALIPSMVFATIGIFYDGHTLLGRKSHTEMTTLQHFPGNKDQFSTLLNDELKDQTTVITASDADVVTTSPATASLRRDQSTAPEPRNTQNPVSRTTEPTLDNTPVQRTAGNTPDLSQRISTARESSPPSVIIPTPTTLPPVVFMPPPPAPVLLPEFPEPASEESTTSQEESTEESTAAPSSEPTTEPSTQQSD